MKTKLSPPSLTESLFGTLIAPAIPLSWFSRWFGLQVKLDREIPDVDIPEEVRKQLGGYLFAEGTIIVDELILSMEKNKDAFAHYSDAAELEGGQVRAQGWQNLQRFFLGLADRCLCLHMLERSATVHRALGILRDVEDRANLAYASAADRARKDAAIRPLLFLRGYHRRRAGRDRG